MVERITTLDSPKNFYPWLPASRKAAHSQFIDRCHVDGPQRHFVCQRLFFKLPSHNRASVSVEKKDCIIFSSILSTNLLWSLWSSCELNKPQICKLATVSGLNLLCQYSVYLWSIIVFIILIECPWLTMLYRSDIPRSLQNCGCFSPTLMPSNIYAAALGSCYWLIVGFGLSPIHIHLPGRLTQRSFSLATVVWIVWIAQLLFC